MEPDRPIEKLLRAYARKRRQEPGAPSELHPATRRLLQSEVARQFKPATTGERSRSRPWWLLQVGWALGIMLILGVTLSVVIPRKNATVNSKGLAWDVNQPAPTVVAPTQLAYAPKDNPRSESQVRKLEVAGVEEQKAKAAPPSVAANEPAAAVQPTSELATRPTARYELERQRATGGTLAGGTAPGPAAPAPVAQAPAETDLVKRQPQTANTSGIATLAEKQLTLNEARPATVKGARTRAKTDTDAASLAAVPTTPPVKFANSLADSLDQNTEGRLFRARTAEARDQRASGDVLNEFQVQQAGRELKIIDHDGSLYTGLIQLPVASPESLADSETASNRARTLYFAAPVASEFSFHVTGTNRTSGMPVVFSGNFISQVLPATNSVLVLTNAFATVNDKLGVAAGSSNALFLENVRISGKATVGTNQAIPIDALPQQK